MVIQYLGHSSFLIKSKESTVVTDPYADSVGFSLPKVEANIVTVSHHHKDHDNAAAVGGDPLVVDYPGEYEKGGTRITGLRSFHDAKQGKERGENVMYKIELEGLSVLHCGDLGELPTDSVLDELGEIDILLVPTGGFYTIDPQEAVRLVNAIEPTIIIPMHYTTADHAKAIFGELTGVEEFVKTFGKEPERVGNQLTVKKEEAAQEMKLIVMERN